MQQYTNLAQSTIGAAYTVGATTLTLATGGGANFPTTGNFTVGICDPPSFYLLCTARSGDVLTVNATAVEGTTAVNAYTGTVVAQMLTAGTLDGIRADINVVGPYASLPVSGMRKGDTYTCIDTSYRFIYDGTSWIPFWKGIPATIPTGSWSWDNQGTSTIDTSVGVHILAASGGGGTYNLNARLAVAPSPPYHYTALIEFDFSGLLTGFVGPSQECAAFVGFKDGTGKYTAVQNTYNYTNSAGAHSFYIIHWPSSTSTPSGTLISYGSNWVCPPMRIRIEDDGTNLNWYMNAPIGASSSGAWQKINTEARGSYLTTGPSYVTWGAYHYGTQPAIVSLAGWAFND